MKGYSHLTMSTSAYTSLHFHRYHLHFFSNNIPYMLGGRDNVRLFATLVLSVFHPYLYCICHDEQKNYLYATASK